MLKGVALLLPLSGELKHAYGILSSSRVWASRKLTDSRCQEILTLKYFGKAQ